MPLVEPISTFVSIDRWLEKLEEVMVLSLKRQLFKAFKAQDQQELEVWIESWPGQLTYLVSQIWFGLKLSAIF